MKIKTKFGLLSIFLGFVLPSIIIAGSHYEYVIEPDIDVYFGHISYLESTQETLGPGVIKEGQKESETGTLNFPIAPGDMIQTNPGGKCEIQFDTGTILRLDSDTEIKVETILAQTLSSRKKLTSIRLNKGQVYVMYKQYVWKEMFQIKTPKAAVKMDHRSVAVIRAGEDDETDVHVIEGKASVLFGPDEENLDSENIKKSQLLTVGQDHRIRYDEKKDMAEDFLSWNEQINDDFKNLHQESFIPKPIQKMPKAVYEFAQKFSTSHGEWLWDGLYGYVWRPFLNKNTLPGREWQPYAYGQWTSVNGHLFWVPKEAWGWVPYHLGIWVWNKKKGWLWLPGSHFAPAWVAWSFMTAPFFNISALGFFGWDFYHWSFDYRVYDPLGWRPLTIADYYDDMLPPTEDSEESNTERGEDEKEKKSISIVSKDRLKKDKDRHFPLPKNLKRVRKKVLAAAENGNKDILASFEKAQKSMVCLSGENLSLPKQQQKLFLYDEISNSHTADTSQTRITLSSRELEKKVKETQEEKDSRADSSQSSSYLNKAARNFRDWNPDLYAARKAGVSVIYSSRTNEIICPEWGLTSKTVRVAFRTGNAHSLSSYRSGNWSSTAHTSSSTTSDRGANNSSGGSSNINGTQDPIKK